MRRFLAMLLVPTALAGCASKPTMKLNHAEISGVQVGFPLQVAVVMRVVVDVYNPNPYDVAIRAVRGQTVIADRYTLPVDFRADGQGVWLPSKHTTTMAVPVNVPVQVGLMVLRDAYGAPGVSYRFTGKADVTATRTFQLEKDDYSVDEKGTIPRQQLELALRSVPVPGF